MSCDPAERAWQTLVCATKIIFNLVFVFAEQVEFYMMEFSLPPCFSLNKDTARYCSL